MRNGQLNNHIPDPETAIIMSAYAGDNFYQFKQALDSIASQTYKKFDLIIKFDGPVDISFEDYINSLSINVILLKSQSNVGLSKSLNQLIDYCVEKKYRYIARMDSDDISLPDRLQVQITHLNKNRHISVLGTYCTEFGSDYSAKLKKVPLSYSDVISFSIHRCPLIHPTVVFRKEIFDSGLRYPEEYPYTEDMALWYECILRGIVIENIPHVGLKYRLTENAIRRRLTIKKGNAEFKLRIKYLYLTKNFSIKGLLIIMIRPFFHALPYGIVKYLYKYAR